MNVVVVGLGNLGSAVAVTLAANGHTVKGWDFNAAVVEEVNHQHSNSAYLPGVTFSRAITANTNLASLLVECPDVVFITLPSAFVERTLSVIKIPVDVPLVNMSKGINHQTGETVFQCLQRLLPDNPTAHLAGPSIANEFVAGVVTCFVVVSSSLVLQQTVAALFNNNHISVQFSSDAVGVELGGILKNCYALGLGVLSNSKQAGLNFKGAYLTLALQEMNQLAVALGAHAETFVGLTGLGDLIATALSDDSHNRQMGALVAKGLTLKQIEQQMGVLAEGYNSLAAILPLAKQQQVDMPLAQLIQSMIAGDITIIDFFSAFNQLLKTPL